MSHKSTNTSKKPARSAVVFALFGIVLLVAVIFFMVILKSQQHSGQTANLDSPNNPTGLGLQSVGGQQTTGKAGDANKDDSSSDSPSSGTGRNSTKPAAGTGQVAENSAPTPSAGLTTQAPTQNLPPTVQDRLIFNADFETGDLSQWGHIQQCPGSISVASDPLNSNNLVGKFTVGDDDIKENCPQPGGSPTSDPRAQTMSSKLFQENGEYYVRFSVFFPSDFPVVTDWFGVMQV